MDSSLANQPDIYVMTGLGLQLPFFAPPQNSHLLIPKPLFPPKQAALSLDTLCLVTAYNMSEADGVSDTCSLITCSQAETHPLAPKHESIQRQ